MDTTSWTLGITQSKSIISETSDYVKQSLILAIKIYRFWVISTRFNIEILDLYVAVMSGDIQEAATAIPDNSELSRKQINGSEWDQNKQEKSENSENTKVADPQSAEEVCEAETSEEDEEEGEEEEEEEEEGEVSYLEYQQDTDDDLTSSSSEFTTTTTRPKR